MPYSETSQSLSVIISQNGLLYDRAGFPSILVASAARRARRLAYKRKATLAGGRSGRPWADYCRSRKNRRILINGIREYRWRISSSSSISIAMKTATAYSNRIRSIVRFICSVLQIERCRLHTDTHLSCADNEVWPLLLSV